MSQKKLISLILILIIFGAAIFVSRKQGNIETNELKLASAHKENLSSLARETLDGSKEQIPIIKNASVEPKDVQPGQTMLVTAEIEDVYGIKEVKADMGGIETLTLELKEGDVKKGVWQAEWLVHDTKTQEYVTKITATNTLGISSQIEVVWTDAANMILLWDDAGMPADPNWTCISCAAGQDFYQKFPYGSDTYGTTGGSDTHTHTGTASTSGPSSATYSQNAGAGSNNAQCAHTHSTSYTVSTESNLPSYRNLKIIRYSGIPATIPKGAIAIFDAAVPSGWTQYSDQNNYFVRGEATAGATGGTNATHTHAVTVTLGGAQQLGGAAAGAYPDWPDHTHTSAVQTSPPADVVPPYIEVILAKANDDVTVFPDGLIAMFGATPSAPWTVISAPGGALYQKFIKGNSSYGVTGGAFHVHSPMSWTSGDIWPAPFNHTRPGAPNVCDSRHTHNISFTFNPAPPPPYRTVIFGKYHSPIPPTVDTLSVNPATITQCSATLTGNITDFGWSATITERGFDWGTETGAYTNSWTEPGSWGTVPLPFDSKDDSGVDQVTGLLPNKTYYFRAKARNIAGLWGYANNELSFLTLPSTKQYTVPFTISTAGDNYVRFYSVDEVGNVETVKWKKIIINNNQPPQARNLEAITTGDQCCGVTAYPVVKLSFDFFDQDAGDIQSAYQIQIDNNFDFSSPELDTGQILSQSNQYAPTSLSWDMTYYWRVKVWDNKIPAGESDCGNPDGWCYTPNDPVNPPFPTLPPGNSFTTIDHPYPFVDFDWYPKPPNQEQEVQFCSSAETIDIPCDPLPGICDTKIICSTDVSTCYDNGLNPISCSGGTFLWTIEPPANGIFVGADTSPNAKIKLHGTDVTLEVYDASFYGPCYNTETVMTVLPLPKWKEIKP
jgi:hypothetical protein